MGLKKCPRGSESSNTCYTPCLLVYKAETWSSDRPNTAQRLPHEVGQAKKPTQGTECRLVGVALLLHVLDRASAGGREGNEQSELRTEDSKTAEFTGVLQMQLSNSQISPPVLPRDASLHLPCLRISCGLPLYKLQEKRRGISELQCVTVWLGSLEHCHSKCIAVKCATLECPEKHGVITALTGQGCQEREFSAEQHWHQLCVLDQSDLGTVICAKACQLPGGS